MTNLAFSDPALAGQARVGIIAASLVSALGALAYFRLFVPSGERHGLV
jgi:hypothetical protein